MHIPHRSKQCEVFFFSSRNESIGILGRDEVLGKGILTGSDEAPG